MPKPISLNVTYQCIDNELAKAFVNDEYVGRVKLVSDNKKPGAENKRLRFRCSRNPQTNTVPHIPDYLFTMGLPMRDLIESHDVLRQLTPVVIRNYLRNFGYLNSL